MMNQNLPYAEPKWANKIRQGMPHLARSLNSCPHALPSLVLSESGKSSDLMRCDEAAETSDDGECDAEM